MWGRAQFLSLHVTSEGWMVRGEGWANWNSNAIPALFSPINLNVSEWMDIDAARDYALTMGSE